MGFLLMLLGMSMLALYGLVNSVRNKRQIKQYEEMFLSHIEGRKRELERSHRIMKKELVDLQSH